MNILPSIKYVMGDIKKKKNRKCRCFEKLKYLLNGENTNRMLNIRNYEKNYAAIIRHFRAGVKRGHMATWRPWRQVSLKIIYGGRRICGLKLFGESVMWRIMCNKKLWKEIAVQPVKKPSSKTGGYAMARARIACKRRWYDQSGNGLDTDRTRN